jgi:hypothetical protein
MIEKITGLFNNTLKDKITFTPSIRIKNSNPMWIDFMTRIKGEIKLGISTREDKMNIKLSSLQEKDHENLIESLENKRYK